VRFVTKSCCKPDRLLEEKEQSDKVKAQKAAEREERAKAFAAKQKTDKSEKNHKQGSGNDNENEWVSHACLRLMPYSAES
jgi:hypothetical protein